MLVYDVHVNATCFISYLLRLIKNLSDPRVKRMDISTFVLSLKIVIHYGEKPITVRKLSVFFGTFRHASEVTVFYFTRYSTVQYSTVQPFRQTLCELSQNLSVNCLKNCLGELSCR